jgi:hypothetical protein
MSDNAYKPEYTLLGIGCNGVYAAAPNKYSDHDASIAIYDTRLACYYGDCVEGAVIVDKRPAFIRDMRAALAAVFSGGMLKRCLPNGTKETFEREIVPIADYSAASGFEYVSLDLYLAAWERMGARIGYRRGNQVCWNDGVVEDIYPEAYRWKNQNGMIRSENHLRP